MEKNSNVEGKVIDIIETIANEGKNIYHRIHRSKIDLNMPIKNYFGWDLEHNNQMNLVFFLEEEYKISISDDDVIKITEDRKILGTDIISILKTYGVIDIQKERRDKIDKLNDSDLQ